VADSTANAGGVRGRLIHKALAGPVTVAALIARKTISVRSRTRTRAPEAASVGGLVILPLATLGAAYVYIRRRVEQHSDLATPATRAEVVPVI
jgi:hypothetical protein